MRYAFLLAVLLLLAGCGSPPGSSVDGKSLGRIQGAGISRFIDDEAGVVCWVYYYGISCLSISQTRLDR